jgi:AAA ATPase domain
MGDIDADIWFDELFERIDAAVTNAEGVVIKWLGDGAMAVFSSAGDALDAAVAMQQGAHIHDLRSKVERAHLRVGVSIGDVSPGRDDWNGMPVVEAARLCVAAERDEILAADVVRILAGSRSGHVMSPAGSYELKGFDEPVDAVRVEWIPAPYTAISELPSSLSAARHGPFVGRSVLLQDLFDTWKATEWRALLIAGEPGIGKTRLVAELAHRAQLSGCPVVIGRCDEELAVSYRPWVEAIGPLIDALDAGAVGELWPEHVGELCRLVPTISHRVTPPTRELAVDADTRHAMVIDAVIALLRIVGPVVIVLDDLHWIDQRSLQLARRVLAADLPAVAIVGTYRDTDLDRAPHLAAALADFRRVDAVRRVALDGLDSAAVVEFLEGAAGHALDDDGVSLARAVHARTSGNPLFVGELLRHLVDTGVLTFLDERWTGSAEVPALPDGLREVIGRRLTNLSSATTHVLHVAAAVGAAFDLELVEEVSASGDALTCLEAAQAAGIVAEVGQSFAFRHAVIRDVLLTELSGARRQRIHRDVAAVLERRWSASLDSHLAELAYHHEQAHSSQAARWYLRAANQAIAGLDLNASTLAERGLVLLDLVQPADPALHCDLLIARASGARLTGAETIDDARRARDAAMALGDHQRIGQALLSVSVRSPAISQAEHLQFLADGLRSLADDMSITRWNVEVALLVREMDIEPAVHRTRVNELVAHLDPAHTLDCQIAMRLVRSLTSTSQPHDALRITERFSAGCNGVDTEGVPLDLLLSTMWMHLGDRDASDRHLASAATDPRRSYWFVDATVRQRLVLGSLLDGDWTAAAESIADLERIGGHDESTALILAAQQSWLRRETGDVETNHRVTNEYQQALPDFPLLRALQVCEVAESGRCEEARAMLNAMASNDFGDVGSSWPALMSIGNVAWAAITVGAAQHAAALQDLLADYRGQIAVMATGTHVLCAVDRLHAGLAALQEHHDEADRLFTCALTQERALRSPPLEARTLHWWGRALHNRGDYERATKVLAEARGLARSLGMQAVVSQIDDLTRGAAPGSAD